MTPDLLSVLRTERRRVRSDVALHAGRVLVVQPEQFADMLVAEMLKHVPYVSRERIRWLTDQAEVDQRSYGGELRRQEQIALARQLAALAKERVA